MGLHLAFTSGVHFPKLTMASRFLYAVLGLNALLLLSQRFQWLGFNQHKGWTVLIAVATTAVSLLLMLGWFVLRQIRGKPQFRLAMVLLLVLTVAVPTAWLAWDIRRANQQKAVLELIRERGGWFRYQADDEERSFRLPGVVSNWLAASLGPDFFSEVAWMDMASSDGIEQLKDVRHLHGVDLSGCRVTDASLEHLSELVHLKHLCLDRTQITDHGLAHLQDLDEMEYLWLRQTRVTDAGLEKLRKELPNCQFKHSLLPAGTK